MSAFGDLSRQIAAAVKARDCKRAQLLAGKLRWTATTAREHHALHSLTQKVRGCQWPSVGLAAAPRKRKRKTAAEKYTHFVVSDDGQIRSGWEFIEDARDAVKDTPGKNRVVARRTLKRLGLDPVAWYHTQHGRRPRIHRWPGSIG